MKFSGISSLILVLFISVQLILPLDVIAQALPQLPTPGTQLQLSQNYVPPMMAGLKVNPQNPLNINFMITTGEENLQGEAFSAEAQKLINYFLATIATPDDEMWVNLSPYEENRIIADGLAQTEMGRDMLIQDYLLKQLTASLMYPETEIGKKFWQEIYAQTQAQLGSTTIPTNTFNKVWIVPEEAVVYVEDRKAYVSKSYLQVMLEQDRGVSACKDCPDLSLDAEQAIREVILPVIEKEVNEGKTFANLRQIYHSMILGTWYKQKLQQTILGEAYINQNKMGGIDLAEQSAKEKIYQQYVESFKTGAFDHIQEEFDAATQSFVTKQYFSGGLDRAQISESNQLDQSSVVQAVADNMMEANDVEFELNLIQPNAKDFDLAMTATPGEGNVLSNRYEYDQFIKARSKQEVVDALEELLISEQEGLVMGVKTTWINAIFTGRKTVEIRRSGEDEDRLREIFNLPFVLLYEDVAADGETLVQKLRGIARIKQTHFLTAEEFQANEDLWNRALADEVGGVDAIKNYFRDQKGFLIDIENVVEFPESVSLTELQESFEVTLDPKKVAKGSSDISSRSKLSEVFRLKNKPVLSPNMSKRRWYYDSWIDFPSEHDEILRTPIWGVDESVEEYIWEYAITVQRRGILYLIGEMNGKLMALSQLHADAPLEPINPDGEEMRVLITAVDDNYSIKEYLGEDDGSFDEDDSELNYEEFRAQFRAHFSRRKQEVGKIIARVVGEVIGEELSDAIVPEDLEERFQKLFEDSSIFDGFRRMAQQRYRLGIESANSTTDQIISNTVKSFLKIYINNGYAASLDKIRDWINLASFYPARMITEPFSTREATDSIEQLIEKVAILLPHEAEKVAIAEIVSKEFIAVQNQELDESPSRKIDNQVLFDLAVEMYQFFEVEATSYIEKERLDVSVAVVIGRIAKFVMKQIIAEGLEFNREVLEAQIARARISLLFEDSIEELIRSKSWGDLRKIVYFDQFSLNKKVGRRVFLMQFNETPIRFFKLGKEPGDVTEKSWNNVGEDFNNPLMKMYVLEGIEPNHPPIVVIVSMKLFEDQYWGKINQLQGEPPYDLMMAGEEKPDTSSDYDPAEQARIFDEKSGGSHLWNRTAQDHTVGLVDASMTATPGGIDLNPAVANFSETGSSFNFEFDEALLADIQPNLIQGIRTAIISITPITSFDAF